MCWFKAKYIIAAVLINGMALMICLPGCKTGAKEKAPPLKYFDLKGYFEKDSSHLTRQNKLVFKSVTHNGVTQSKNVHIANWGIELSLFKASDINKPAWKDSYTVTSNDDSVVYKANEPDLKTRKMLIKMEKQKVKSIIIFNSAKNILYQTTEKLSYFPDSLYLIEKYQRVKLMGTNNYKIEGRFIK